MSSGTASAPCVHNNCIEASSQRTSFNHSCKLDVLVNTHLPCVSEYMHRHMFLHAATVKPDGLAPCT